MTSSTNLNSFHNNHFITWACDKLSFFLGLDDATLRSDMIPYLFSFKTSIELRGHLVDILGSDGEVRLFIDEFIHRRFAKSNREIEKLPSIKPPAQEKYSSKQELSDINSWSAKLKQQSASTATSSSSLVTSSSQSKKVSSSYLISEKMSKKSKAKSREITGSNPTTLSNSKLEAQLKTLEKSTSETSIQRQRRHCNCLATRHPLLTIAPNCLNCGKIVCEVEGPGPCTFCGNPVVSRDQQLQLLAQMKAQKTLAKQHQHKQGQKKGKAVNKNMATVYAAKMGGANISHSSSNPVLGYGENKDDNDGEALRKAEEHVARLLEFDRTSAKRSTVIDQSTSFDLPAQGVNKWLSPQEQANQIKQQQRNLTKLTMPKSEKRRVMTLNLTSKTVSMHEVSDISDDEDQKSSYPTNMSSSSGFVTKLTPSGDKGKEILAGTYSNNPHLQKFSRPIYVCNENGKSKDKNREQRESKSTISAKPQKSRLQYDDEISYEVALSGV